MHPSTGPAIVIRRAGDLPPASYSYSAAGVPLPLGVTGHGIDGVLAVTHLGANPNPHRYAVLAASVAGASVAPLPLSNTTLVKFQLSFSLTSGASVVAVPQSADDLSPQLYSLVFSFRCGRPVCVTAVPSPEEVWDDSFPSDSSGSSVAPRLRLRPPSPFPSVPMGGGGGGGGGSSNAAPLFQHAGSLSVPVLFPSGSHSYKSSPLCLSSASVLALHVEVFGDVLYDAALSMTSSSSSSPPPPSSDAGSVPTASSGACAVTHDEYVSLWEAWGDVHVEEVVGTAAAAAAAAGHEGGGKEEKPRLRPKELPESKTIYFGVPKNVADAKPSFEDDAQKAYSLSEVRSFLCVQGGVHASSSIFGVSDGSSSLGVGGVGKGASSSSSDDDNDGLCIVCLSERKTVAIKPCMHFCVCEDCAQQMRRIRPQCPICRGDAEGFVTLTKERREGEEKEKGGAS